MSDLPAALRDLIASGPMAHLSTVNAEGSPQVTVIWVGLDGGDLVTGHMGWRAKLGNTPKGPGYIARYSIERVGGVGPWAR